MKREVEAASADGVTVAEETVNLTGEWAAPCAFATTDEQKPCPVCGHAVVITRQRLANILHCGNGHCRSPNCGAEFCWECLEVFDGGRRTRGSASLASSQHLRALGGGCKRAASGSS